jgi:dienelactone hydrolase
MRLLPLLFGQVLFGQYILPNTTRWDFPADIVAEQYAELRAFYERQWKRPGPVDADAIRPALRTAIGAIDAFRKPEPVIEKIGEAAGVRASYVQWPILRIGTIGPTAGFSGALVRLYGVLLEPAGEGRYPAAVAIPGADMSVAEFVKRFGGTQPERIVFVPFFTQRRAFSQVWLEDRQWLMRLAYQTGRHIIGSEVQQILAAADWLRTRPNVEGGITIGGLGDGAQLAMLAAALDNRFDAVFARGESPGTPEWDLPPDRLLWKIRARLAPEDLAAIVQPREIGEIPQSPPNWTVRLDPDRAAQISNHRFRQWEAYYRNLALESWRKRDAKWKPDFSSPAAYERSLASKRDAYFEMVGTYPPPSGPLSAKSVRVYDEPAFAAYRLQIKLYDNVHAYGILCVPKGLQPGERRPVVFVSHGLAGKPEDSIGLDPKARPEYSKFGMRLAERGYIVFAVMIATQDNVERQKLIRRAHPVGLTPAGMDVAKFNRSIDFLETLPFVDRTRIAFYGPSYGGFTALWTGPGVPRFKVVICSGHFNDWAAKTTDLTMGTAYPHYANVEDQYNFGMLDGFDHSDLASLIAPRAFMVEMGDTDGIVVEPRWAADREIEQALEPFRKLGIRTKGRVARFDGPHRIDGAEAYAFLDEQLNFKPAR